MSAISEVEVSDFTFIWRIHDFSTILKSTGESICSPTFTTIEEDNSDSETKWRLVLYPCGFRCGSKNFISLFLLNESLGCRIEIQTQFELHILSSANEKMITEHFSHTFTPTDPCSGSDRFIKIEVLKNLKDTFLPTDKLTVSCRICTNVWSDIKTTLESNIMDDFENLLNTGKFSDVTINVEGKELKAHKNILTARSKFFSQIIFEQDVQEDKESHINITDTSYNVMKKVLQYIYSGRVGNIDKKLLVSLLAAANKYELDELKIKCEAYFWNNINVEDSCGILNLAYLYKCRVLKKKVIDFIVENQTEVIKTTSFQTLKEVNPKILADVLCAVVENKW